MSTVTKALLKAANPIDKNGWTPRRGHGAGLDILDAIEKACAGDENLEVDVWDAIVTHLDEQLIVSWEREVGRSQADALAMLRAVAAKAGA